jgi:hypothetical protein
MSISFKGAGLTLVLKENDNISILMAKSNSDEAHKKNVWIFPGGHNKEGETPYQTAYREFIEEVFNVVVSDEIVNEIINLIIEDKNMYPINTVIPSNNSKPSYSHMQSSDSITHFVNVLKKYDIRSDVFPFGYNGLYNSNKKVNIYQFCAQRRYINDPHSFEKNELVFITMIPLNNIIYSINRTGKFKEIFHYHGENLRIYVPSSIKQIKYYFDKINQKKL